MLLAIDASRANNEQKTGVEWYAYFVIQGLKKIIPPEVKVVLYSREPLRGALADLPANWKEKVLRWTPKRLWTQIRLSFEMCRCPPDILFVPAHVLPLVCPAKVVTTIHDLGGIRFPTGYSWFERRYARLALRLALKRAVILTPSEFVCQEIKYLGEGKIKVIPNGYDASLFKMIDKPEKIEAVLRKYHIQRPYFLSISRLEEKKNTVGIVQAFEIFKDISNNSAIQQLNNFSHPPLPPLGQGGTANVRPTPAPYQLVLLGKPGYGYGRVKKVIDSSQYKNDIILPGWVATEDVPYLMAGASAFVFPSFYEGFGIPILEAMACGAPVIASATGALPEVAGDAALLVNPNKPGEIAQALREIVSLPELRQELVKRGLERVKDFSWEKTARLVFDIIQKMT